MRDAKEAAAPRRLPRRRSGRNRRRCRPTSPSSRPRSSGTRCAASSGRTCRCRTRPATAPISFSWCGKIRSLPPPCRSNVAPRCAAVIAEHSMCQPGRPGPQGRRPPGLAGLGRLPQREVRGGRACACRPRRARRRASSSRVTPLSRPYSGKRLDAEVDVAVRRGTPCPRRSAARTIAMISPMCVETFGSTVGGRHGEARHVAVVGLGEARRERDRILAGLVRALDDLVVDVGDVADVADLVAEERQRAADRVERDRGVRVADMRGGRTASGRRRTCRPGLPRAERTGPFWRRSESWRRRPCGDTVDVLARQVPAQRREPRRGCLGGRRKIERPDDEAARRCSRGRDGHRA